MYHSMMNMSTGGGGSSGGGSGGNNNNNFVLSSSSGGGGNSDDISQMDPTQQELYRLRVENSQLRQKITERTTEAKNLRGRITDCYAELADYKQLLQTLHTQTTISGDNNGTNGDVPIELILHRTNALLSKVTAKRKYNKWRRGDIGGGPSGTGTGSSKSGLCDGSTKNGGTTNHVTCHCCSADRPFLCDWPACGKRYRTKQNLDAHRNTHTGRRFVCDHPDCGKSFARPYNLIEHRKLHNSSTAMENVCHFDGCNGVVFSSKYALARHQQQQHANKVSSLAKVQFSVSP